MILHYCAVGSRWWILLLLSTWLYWQYLRKGNQWMSQQSVYKWHLQRLYKLIQVYLCQWIQWHELWGKKLSNNFVAIMLPMSTNGSFHCILVHNMWIVRFETGVFICNFHIANTWQDHILEEQWCNSNGVVVSSFQSRIITKTALRTLHKTFCTGGNECCSHGNLMLWHKVLGSLCMFVTV